MSWYPVWGKKAFVDLLKKNQTRDRYSVVSSTKNHCWSWRANCVGSGAGLFLEHRHQSQHTMRPHTACLLLQPSQSSLSRPFTSFPTPKSLCPRLREPKEARVGISHVMPTAFSTGRIYLPTFQCLSRSELAPDLWVFGLPEKEVPRPPFHFCVLQRKSPGKPGQTLCSLFVESTVLGLGLQLPGEVSWL